jgi:hypothetical protein
MQLHHIKPEGKGGPNTLANCIPLCLNCHQEVGAYNPSHPIGRSFSEEELRGHRDLWFEFVKLHPHAVSASEGPLFRRTEGSDEAPFISAKVEPIYREGTFLLPGGRHERKEAFAAKVRNTGRNPIYVDEIGFTAGEREYKGLFHPWGVSSKTEDVMLVKPGDSQIFSHFGTNMDTDDLPKLDGMYLVLGTGHKFINKASLARFIEDWRRSLENGEAS